jgi:hypothetical protein
MDLSKGQAAIALLFAFIIVVIPGEPVWLYLADLNAIYGAWAVWIVAVVLVIGGAGMMWMDFYASYGFFIAAIGGMLVIVFSPIVFPTFAVSI